MTPKILMKIFQNIEGYEVSIMNKKNTICINNVEKCRNIMVGEPENDVLAQKLFLTRKGE